jgi:hypothetical protein
VPTPAAGEAINEMVSKCLQAQSVRIRVFVDPIPHSTPFAIGIALKPLSVGPTNFYFSPFSQPQGTYCSYLRAIHSASTHRYVIDGVSACSASFHDKNHGHHHTNATGGAYRIQVHTDSSSSSYKIHNGGPAGCFYQGRSFP